MKKVHRRRSSKGALLGIVLGLLTGVALSGVIFVAFIHFSGMSVIPAVIASGREEVPVWAENPQNNPDEPPGWLGLGPDTEPEPEEDTPELQPPIEPGQEIYAAFPFYIAENARAYAAFHAENPHLDAETVVWKVNAFLHLPFYSYIRVNRDPNPLLVNPSHRLPYGFVPAFLIPVDERYPEILATPETVEAFRRLRASGLRSNFDFAVLSAYRTAEHQRGLWERQGSDGVVARPYQSEHQTGRALDLWNADRSGFLDGGGGPPSEKGLWIAENAHNYGFIVRYTAENSHITGFINEPWHITYVGVQIAQYMHRNNISSLEEFVARNP